MTIHNKNLDPSLTDEEVCGAIQLTVLVILSDCLSYSL